MGHFNSTNIKPTRAALTVKCEYCSSFSKGEKCTHCGAPLPDPFASATPDNTRRFVAINNDDPVMVILKDLGLA